MKHHILRTVLCGLALCGITLSMSATDYLYVYKDGVIRHRQPKASVDSIAMEQGKTLVTLYDAQHNVLYTAPRSEVDSISTVTDVPQADLLDVIFNEDGTAQDISPMQMAVQSIGKSHYVTYSGTYRRNIATFSNPWASTASGYYKVDFENNVKFRNALADGHTMECLVMASYSGTIANSEAKPFSAMEGGGTGFLVSTISGARQNELTFLPNVSENGSSTWRWATSGIVPQPGTYYHLVGVWNKSLKKAQIYVNGELKNTVNAPGELRFANAGNNWFALGGDPSGGSSCSNGWSGSIVLARVYDSVLSQKQVSALWRQVSTLQENAVPDMVTGISFMSGLPVATGTRYTIQGTGFAQGDQLQIQAVGGGTQYVVDITLTPDGCYFIVPEAMPSGNYRFTLVRGEQTQIIGTSSLNIGRYIEHGMKVIAHRGHWNVQGSAQNSVSSLRNAFAEQCYGSETDVWITTDGHVMVNHDATFGGVRIETSTYAQCKNLTLGNGEKMPQIQDFLDLLQHEDSTKLIIEIKTHSDEARGKACCDSVVAMVKRMGLQDKVEYIGFSINLCRQIVLRDPQAHVAYLNGDLAPKTLYDYGVMGLDYTAANYRNHPTWAKEARQLGMTTNVWTIDDTATMIEMSNLGIDYVTTNNPVAAKQVYAYYAQNYVPEEERTNPAKCDSAFANLLNIRFNEDGTVEDLSPMKMPVEVFSENNRTIPVEYNQELKTYVGKFENAWAGTANVYCKVRYADNDDFKAALADGHTIECTFCPIFEGTLPNKEVKPFSSHQGGGTGFLISTTSGARQNEITFLPNVTENDKSTWRWATSGIVPQSGTYYHVVGVWNKEEHKAYIYVNGELRNTVDAPGELKFPTDGSHWFGIGCDPSGESKGEASANWRIASARIYDKPLTPEEVSKLW